MQQGRIRFGAYLAGLLALGSLTPASGQSDTEYSSITAAKGGSDKIRYRLRIGDDRVDEVSSKFEYRVNKGLARIKGTLKLWVTNLTTGVTAETAADAESTATFSRNGNDYAECDFAFDRIIDGRIAEYAFVARQTGKPESPRLRLQKGSCDIDLPKPGLQAGIPAAQEGDLVEVEFHVEGGEHIPLGEGTLK